MSRAGEVPLEAHDPWDDGLHHCVVLALDGEQVWVLGVGTLQIGWETLQGMPLKAAENGKNFQFHGESTYDNIAMLPGCQETADFVQTNGEPRSGIVG